MKKINLAISVLLIFFTTQLIAQNPTAKEILQKSIAYHDPKGKVMTQEVKLLLNEPRPDGAARNSTLVSNLSKEYFSIDRVAGDHKIKMTLEKGNFSGSLDGNTDISQEEITKHKITKERLTLLRDYYQYLWFLPMKLNDPGTILGDEVLVKDFFGKEGFQIKVTYSPEVGKDTWYFYFDQSTYALIGYRFYHDESKNDGEYILLEGEVAGYNVRIPAIRKWYKHQKDEYLGEDHLKQISIKN